MRETLRHRGPDSEGIFISESSRLGFAFRRLSIIDLSEAGNQPMLDRHGSTVIVFNGEVYNFVSLADQLRERGHSFRSRCDAEVVLHAYEEFGTACIHRFHGMFSFALWDESKRSLFLARDRFGIKPLYYFYDGRYFLFASEIKALLVHPVVSRQIDRAALNDYLTYGYVPHDRSIFTGIRKLPAGHYLVFQEGKVSIQKYWELVYAPKDRTTDELLGDIRTKLQEAVALWSVSDVPVGLFLSGGLDSSSVCAMMGDRQPKVQTFSIGFDYERRNELPFARLIASSYGTDHREAFVSLETAKSLLPVMAQVYDEPFFDTSSVPTYYLSRFARKYVKVAMTGDGGDELFFGYGWYRRFLELSKDSKSKSGLSRSVVGNLVGAVRGFPFAARLASLEKWITPDPVARYFRLIGFFDEWEKQRLLGPALPYSSEDSLWLFRKFFRSDYPLVAALRTLDVSTYLVDDILTKLDRASMANSLEVRTPLLDHLFAEFIMTIPVEEVFRDRQEKSILKRAMSDVLPDPILKRGKRGFSSPIRYWLRGPLGQIARDRLLRGYAVRDGIFNPNGISSMMNNFTENRWAKMWLLLMFEGWYRRWVHNIEEDQPVPHYKLGDVA